MKQKLVGNDRKAYQKRCRMKRQTPKRWVIGWWCILVTGRVPDNRPVKFRVSEE